MKAVMEQYTSGVVAVICLLFLWRIIFSEDTSLIGQLGESGVFDIQQKVSAEKGVAFDMYKSVRTPEISVVDKYLLSEGQFIFPRDMFQGISHKEEAVEVSIEGVWNLQGEEVIPIWNEHGGFSIMEKGIYWIYLKARDEGGYERGVFMKFFVNER